MSDQPIHHKGRADAPHGLFAAEAAGLAWLAETTPDGGAPVVEVLGHDDRGIDLARLTASTPTPRQGFEFGARLARTHAAGAVAFGAVPQRDGRAWFGPLEDPFPVPTTHRSSFAEFWSRDRLAVVRELIAQGPTAMDLAPVDEAIAAVASGAFDGIAGHDVPEPASRVHGDLWAGNVVWTSSGGVLIDPAAHGGHRLEDLALLALFGAPQLEQIFAGYVAEHPLPEGWTDDLVAHSLFALLAHVHLFGAGYVSSAERASARVAELARGRG